MEQVVVAQAEGEAAAAAGRHAAHHSSSVWEASPIPHTDVSSTIARTSPNEAPTAASPMPRPPGERLAKAASAITSSSQSRHQRKSTR